MIKDKESTKDLDDFFDECIEEVKEMTLNDFKRSEGDEEPEESEDETIRQTIEHIKWKR